MCARTDIANAMHMLGSSVNQCIENATPSTVLMFAPHLDVSEASGLVLRAKEHGIAEFIGPPILIRGAEHKYRLRINADSMLSLLWVGCHRRRESYERVLLGTPVGWQRTKADYRERVADYAEITYGNSLHWDVGQTLIQYDIVDPTAGNYPDWTMTHLTTSYPNKGMTAVVSYSATLQGMIEHSQYRYPLLQALEQNFFIVATNTFEAAELCGVARPVVATNCFFCGGGLTTSECTFCHRQFNKDVTLRHDSWLLPVPHHVYTAAHWTHKFTLDPINAVKSHYAKWAMQGFVAPASSGVNHLRRVITLRDTNED